jgi:hypothetical protein
MKLRVARKVFNRDPEAFAWMADCLLVEFEDQLVYRKTTMRRAGARWEKHRRRQRRLFKGRNRYFQMRRNGDEAGSAIAQKRAGRP